MILHPHRRAILAAGAAALAGATTAQAQSAAPLRVIDFHNHYIGPAFRITANASTPAAQLVN